MGEDLPLLAAEGVVAGYVPDVDILHGVDVAVHREEIVCIIGPNGAGKSTLIKAIFGLLDLRGGEVRFRGDRVDELEPKDRVRRGMSYVPQRDNVFARLTVEENLELGAWIEPAGVDEAMENVFDLFPDLTRRRDQKVQEMSGGQQQMVAMGRALMTDPDLLIFDEPSAGLAPNLVDDVFDNIEEVAATGTAILLVEQNAKKGLSHSDRGYVLDQGENRFEGTGQELLEDPDVGRLYLGR